MAAARRSISQMRRLLPLLSHDTQPSLLLPNKEPSRQLFPVTSTIFTRGDFCRRALQTQTNPASVAYNDSENHETGYLKPESNSVNPPSQLTNEDASSLGHSVTSNLKMSSRHDFAMIFTCKVCETRSIKTASRESYEKGVVVARCGGCDNLHLISDRLGWFGEPGSIEDFLAARGEEVKKGSTDTLNLTLEDLAGKKILKD